MSVEDLSEIRREELAKYLNEFGPITEDNEDKGPEQYWWYLADHLRKTHTRQFDSYTNNYLVTVGGKKDPALHLLHDLAVRKLNLVEFVESLKTIGCRRALNVFTDATPPVINQQPINQHVIIRGGEKVVLSVEADCKPGKPVYQWFKERDPLVRQTSSTLSIKNLNRQHSGNYCCRVTNPFINDPHRASVFSKAVCLEVVGDGERHTYYGTAGIQETGDVHDDTLPPNITLHPSPITTLQGKKVTLKCTAVGAKVYDWYKDGKAVKLSSPNGLLEFEAVKVSDGGVYHCVAVNSAGKMTKSQHAKINVECGITFEEEPKDVSIRLSGEIELRCSASNVYEAPMKYQWFQENQGLLGEGSVFRTKLARNRHVEIKIYCQVTLLDSPEITARSKSATVTVDTVWIIQQPHSVKGAIGSRETLKCRAEGIGNITYLWLMSRTKGDKKVVVERNNHGVLVLNKLAQKDWGYYICQAENEHQFVSSNEVLVSAHLPYALELRRKRATQPPLIRIVRHPWSQVVPRNGKFRVLCEAVCTGDEPLKYQWYCNGRQLPGATKSAYNRERVRDTDYGSYYCVVTTNTNKSTDVSKTARIEQAYITPPGTPPSIVGKSGSQVRLGEAERYQITLKQERFARMKVALLIGNQRYQKMNALVSPENDIRELRSLLEDELDFKVISLVNLTHTEMMQALERFYEMLAVSGIYALFYYSGHGFSSNDRDYLVPVDANVPLRSALNINVEGIIKQMQNKLSRAIVVLDCCRVVEDMISIRPDSSMESLPEAIASMSNYVLISSCMRNNPAYDSYSEPNSVSSDFEQHQRGGGPAAAAAAKLSTAALSLPPSSYFNIAFRDALRSKRSVYDVYHYVLQRFIKDGYDEQRPVYKGSFSDKEITFHDEVMMDDQGNEDKLNKIMETYEQAHTVPGHVFLEGQDVGILRDLVRVELCFWYNFSNVLCVETNLHLLSPDKATTSKVVYDLQFLERQGVTGEQGECVPSSSCQSAGGVQEEEDEGGEGEGSEMFFTTTLKISNIQRLGEKDLKLVFTVTVQEEGQDKVATVSYQLPQKPLFASILHV